MAAGMKAESRLLAIVVGLAGWYMVCSGAGCWAQCDAAKARLGSRTRSFDCRDPSAAVPLLVAGGVQWPSPEFALAPLEGQFAVDPERVLVLPG